MLLKPPGSFVRTGLIPNLEILALAELRPKLGEIACNKYGIPRYYKDHNALLDDPNIARTYFKV